MLPLYKYVKNRLVMTCLWKNKKTNQQNTHSEKVTPQKVFLGKMEITSRNLSQICFLETMFSKAMAALQQAWLNYQICILEYAGHCGKSENSVQLGLKQDL